MIAWCLDKCIQSGHFLVTDIHKIDNAVWLKIDQILSNNNLKNLSIFASELIEK